MILSHHETRYEAETRIRALEAAGFRTRLQVHGDLWEVQAW